MRIFFVFIVGLYFNTCFANSIKSKIHDIDLGEQINEEVLIFLSTGMVLKLKAPDAETLSQLQKAKYEGVTLQIEHNNERQISTFRAINEPFKPEIFAYKSAQVFTPSIIESREKANSIFLDSRRNTKESQCYNRAHIWSYEWRVKHQLYSSKAWLFFTRKYIRKFNFEWWFHVSPYFHVVESNKVRERIADVKYGRNLLTFKSWTNIFLQNDAECPVVSFYSDQANYPESGWCYLMKSSMYYYQPIDLELIETEGIQRNSWIEEEVRAAYLEAFNLKS